MRSVVLSAQLVLLAVSAIACSSAGSPTAPSPLASTGAPAIATSSPGGTSQTFTTNGGSSSSQSLASFIASANQGLLQISALEKSNGELPEVKAFAAQIFQDLSLAQDDLRESSGSQVSQSIGLNSSDQQTHTQLSRMTGSGLDRAYLSAVLQMLTANIAELKRRGVSSSSSDLNGQSGGSMSRVNRYYFMARDLASRVGVPVCDAGSNGSGNGSTNGSNNGSGNVSGNCSGDGTGTGTGNSAITFG